MYCTAFGAWGDTIAALGNIEYLVYSMKLERNKVTVIYLGQYKDIPEFIESQGYKVLPAIVESYNDRWSVFNVACREGSMPYEWLHLLKKVSNSVNKVQANQVYSTHCRNINVRVPIRLPSRLLIPDKYVEWARIFFRRALHAPFLVVNPLSIQSVGINDHWPYWNAAIRYVSSIGIKVVIVGDSQNGAFNYSNVYDIAGTTESMLQVYALSDLSDGVFTTSNNLSMYCPINNKPCFCALNSRFYDYPDNYFARWLNATSAYLMPFDTPFESFKQMFDSWISKIDITNRGQV